MYTYPHPRAASTVDIAIFMPDDEQFAILLIQRSAEPFRGLYALPGGFMEIQETLEEAALRELKEETGLENIRLTQVQTFSAVDRDPRGRVISTCFAAIVAAADQSTLQAGSDASQAAWFNLNELPPLAFDHAQIIRTVVDKYLSPRIDL